MVEFMYHSFNADVFSSILLYSVSFVAHFTALSLLKHCYVTIKVVRLWKEQWQRSRPHVGGSGIFLLQTTWNEFTAATLWFTIDCNSNPWGIARVHIILLINSYMGLLMSCFLSSFPPDIFMMAFSSLHGCCNHICMQEMHSHHLRN